MKKNNIAIYSFYRFVDINNVNFVKNVLKKKLDKEIIRGTILISKEGINGSISGFERDSLQSIKTIKKVLNIRKLSLKINYNKFVPFYRLKIKIKKEIVSLGRGNVSMNLITGKFIDPKDWHGVLNDSNIKIIDTRNQYEIGIGKFKNSININMKSFRDFPKQINKTKLKKTDTIAMYCTGGIRCEKASSYLINEGFKNILQLNGGILNYLDFIKKTKSESLWKGECFVFDNRVAVNHNLEIGSFDQCHGCRHPITNEHKKSKYFIKGVCCPKCYDQRSEKQLNKSTTRQEQINIAEKNKIDHPFKKLFIEDLE